MIKHEDKDTWQALADAVAIDRPGPGKQVVVAGGRKHKGKAGVVTRHQLDKFSDAYRYGSGASDHLRDMRGRDGWVCLVDTGAETFWVKASYLNVVK